MSQKEQVRKPLPVAAEPAPKEVELPSQGLLGYDTKILIRPYVTKEIRLLNHIMSPEYDSVLTELLDSCIKSDVKANDLSSQDRSYLLTWLRINSFSDGHLLKFKTQCPHCEKVQDSVADLSKLKIKKLSDTGYTNPLPELPLPGFGEQKVAITLGTITGADEIAIDAYLKSKLGKKHRKDTWFVRAAQAVRSIDGISDTELNEKVEWMETLPAPAFQLIKEKVESYNFGIDFETKVTCSNNDCKEDLDVEIPFRGEFFFPKSSN
jgi:hypothetical protein